METGTTASVHPGTARPWFGWALLLVALTLGAFGPGLAGGFVLDDKYAILGHPAVTGGVPAWEAFTRTFWGTGLDTVPPSYRPLSTLAFSLDRALFGLAPLPFHCTSLLWYVALVLLGFRVAQLWMDQRSAFFAAALFAVSPVHVENVASLVGRAETISWLACLLALLALGPALTNGSRAGPLRLTAAVASFAAALLAKESAAVLPLIVGVLVAAGAHPLPRRPWAHTHLPTLVLGATLAVYLVLRQRLIPQTFAYVAPDDVIAGAGTGTRLLYGLEILAHYARLLVAPVNLCTGRKYAMVARPDGISAMAVVGLVLLGTAVGVSIKSLRRGRMPFMLCALLAWALVSGLAFSMPEAMADRFLLAPCFFIALALGPAARRWSDRDRWRRGLLAAAIVLQVVLSAFQSTRWRSEETLLAHSVVSCPSSVHNHARYADLLAGQGRTAEAVWHYAVASAGRSRFPGRWEHPAADAELTLGAEERTRRMHQLLHIERAEPEWRVEFASFLRAAGHPREASLVLAPPAAAPASSPDDPGR